MDDLVDVLNEMPFAKRLGIEMTRADGGHAEGRLELDDWDSSTPVGTVAHGGVTYSLADSVGGAAVISLNDPPTATRPGGRPGEGRRRVTAARASREPSPGSGRRPDTTRVRGILGATPGFPGIRQ